MTTEFNIRRTDTELHIRVVVKYPVILRYLLPAFLATITGLVFYKDGSPVALASVIIAGGAIGILPLRDRSSELLANNFEFIGRGRFGMQYNRAKVIPRADILGFKYKKSDLTEPIGRPRGLYAVRAHFSTCILAYIDEKQCNEAVEAIYERFPEMRASAPFERAFD
jgi:hypothetical protein